MKKLIELFIALTFMFHITVPVFASEPSHVNEEKTTFVETIDIDGVNYTFYHDYSTTKREITISNDSNNVVDIVTYEIRKNSLYLNGELLATCNISAITPILPYSVTADDDWTLLSRDVYNVTWAKGTNSAVAAAALAAFLPALGTAGVIAAIGSATLGALAASAVGGTLYLEISMFHIPPSTPTYRYKWSFTASTGESYGPFYYHYA